MLRALLELGTPERGPTMRELAAHSQVGFTAARRTLARCIRAGSLVIARRRPMAHSRRPPAEYALAPSKQVASRPHAALVGAMSSWFSAPAG